MARSTKIVGFSLPPEVYKQLDKLTKTKHKTRSEFIRELIDFYSDALNRTPQSIPEGEAKIDLAKILRSYWELRSHLTLKTITVGLAIIVNKNGEVLIGARKDKDQWVKNLTWVFPGGGLNSLDFEKELKREVLEETGINVDVHSLVTARIHPNSEINRAQVVALYFFCTPKNVDAKPKDGLAKIKWVKPLEVFKYFTTSVSDEVTKFLQTLEK